MLNMKKLFPILFILFVSGSIVSAQNLTLDTYYPAPFGSYDHLRLVPIDPTEMNCDVNATGTLFVESNNNTIQYCDGSDYATLPGVWVHDSDNDIVSLANDDIDGINGKSHVGIGTKTPAFQLTIEGGGGILAKGGDPTDLAIPDASDPDEVKMIWYPKKYAFRAGESTGNEWDDANIGDYSFAVGQATKAGYFGIAMGIGSEAYDNAFAAGSYSKALDAGGLALGYQAEATNVSAAALGYRSQVNGHTSIAFGKDTTAQSQHTVVFGHNTTASGSVSTAMGYGTTASGNYSTAMGTNTYAQSFASLVLGRYNIVEGNANSWVDTDPLFVIGNGADSENPGNAMTVLKDGSTGINTGAPKKHLHIFANTTPNNNAQYSNLPGVVIEGSKTALQIIGSLESSHMSHLLLSGAPSASGNDNKHWIMSHWGPDSGNRFSIAHISSSADNFDIGSADNNPAIAILPANNNVGIGTNTPTQRLHVNGVMRIEPVTDAPATCNNATDNDKGMLYVDDSGAIGTLCFCNGTQWLPIAWDNSGAGGSCN